MLIDSPFCRSTVKYGGPSLTAEEYINVLLLKLLDLIFSQFYSIWLNSVPVCYPNSSVCIPKGKPNSQLYERQSFELVWKFVDIGLFSLIYKYNVMTL